MKIKERELNNAKRRIEARGGRRQRKTNFLTLTRFAPVYNQATKDWSWNEKGTVYPHINQERAIKEVMFRVRVAS